MKRTSLCAISESVIGTLSDRMARLRVMAVGGGVVVGDVGSRPARAR